MTPLSRSGLQAPLIAACAAAGLMVTQAEAQTSEAPPTEQSSAPAQGSAPPLESAQAGVRPGSFLKGFSVIPGFSLPLDTGGPGAQDAGERTPTSPMATLGLRYTPSDKLFAHVTLNGYLSDDRQPWQGDFSYAFGYDDWRPNTFSLVYANYTNNRFNPRDGDPVTRFEYGTISAGYKFQLPQEASQALWADEQRVNCRAGYHATPRYETLTQGDKSWRQSVSLGCRVPVWKMLFADVTGYAYVGGDKQPWDPDFVYSFGWFDWRPGGWSVQYSNYSGNRYPGADRALGTGRFKDGTISVTYNHAF